MQPWYEKQRHISGGGGDNNAHIKNWGIFFKWMPHTYKFHKRNPFILLILITLYVTACQGTSLEGMNCIYFRNVAFLRKLPCKRGDLNLKPLRLVRHVPLGALIADLRSARVEPEKWKTRTLMPPLKGIFVFKRKRVSIY